MAPREEPRAGAATREAVRARRERAAADVANMVGVSLWSRQVQPITDRLWFHKRCKKILWLKIFAKKIVPTRGQRRNRLLFWALLQRLIWEV